MDNGDNMDTLDKKTSIVKPDLNQPRKTFDPVELAHLKKSLFARQDIPLIALPDGERRWLAARLEIRVKTLDVVITHRPLTPVRIDDLVSSATLGNSASLSAALALELSAMM
jgi:hypothetical protein